MNSKLVKDGKNLLKLSKHSVDSEKAVREYAKSVILEFYQGNNLPDEDWFQARTTPDLVNMAIRNLKEALYKEMIVGEDV